MRAETKDKTFLFDPGFAKHTTILSVNIDYIYAGISRFKNFSRRKMQFKMLYSKIKKITDNNTGFCLGSLLWAAYLKTQDGIIEGNPCLDTTYDKQETVEEADYSINFYSQLQKDTKYYLGTNYEIDPLHVKILELYKEFLILNRGFVCTRTTKDIVLPAAVNTVLTKENAQKIYDKIQQVIQSGNLLDLTEVFTQIYKV